MPLKEPKPGDVSYGSYLRVPQLTNLQCPVAQPPVRGEMFFIIGQQVQELWFKQILYDLRRVMELGEADLPHSAAHLLDRSNRILAVLSQETELLQTLPPAEFKAFRPVLSTASGFESEQFRELEWASGLREPHFERLLSRLHNGLDIMARWPRSLRDMLRYSVREIHPDPVEAIRYLYDGSAVDRALLGLLDALSEYEVRFAEWRFHHVKVVERMIGNRAPGTGGSSGSEYLGRTLEYRFFPELWEARSRLSAT